MNYTESVLRFKPQWTQDQKRLTCLSYNPIIITDNDHLQSLIDYYNVTELETSKQDDGQNDDYDDDNRPLSWDSIILDIKCKLISFFLYIYMMKRRI